MKVKGIELNGLEVKQRQVITDENFTLSGASFSIDNESDDDVTVFIGNGNIGKVIKTGEMFLLESVQNGYYPNINFRINFSGVGAKKVLIWYTDYIEDSKC